MTHGTTPKIDQPDDERLNKLLSIERNQFAQGPRPSPNRKPFTLSKGTTITAHGNKFRLLADIEVALDESNLQ